MPVSSQCQRESLRILSSLGQHGKQPEKEIDIQGDTTPLLVIFLVMTIWGLDFNFTVF